MNALAHYLLLKAKLDGVSAEEAEKSRTKAKELYRRLEDVDEDRKQRYRDMGVRC